MAKSAGSGYKSKVDIGLGRMPKMQDPVLYPEMVEIYNAIHTLNSYVDVVREGNEIGKKGETIDKQMPFKAGYWGIAFQDLKAGDVVCYTSDGIKKGIQMRSSRRATLNWGIALNDAKEGEEVQMGVPPAVINVPGVKLNEVIHGAKTSQTKYAGSLLRGELDEGDSAPIGLGILQDYVYLIYSYY